MVYGEMGRFPMDIVIKLRMVMFWYEPDINDIF
jgi:hypothetical protein